MHSCSIIMIIQPHWSYEVMKWMRIDWLDLPKLTSLTTLYSDSYTFRNPRHITLESDSHPLWMMFRHAQTHLCVSSKCILLQESRHNHRKYSLHPSLTNRHRSTSTLLQLITEKLFWIPRSHCLTYSSTLRAQLSVFWVIHVQQREKGKEIMTVAASIRRYPIRMKEMTICYICSENK